MLECMRRVILPAALGGVLLIAVICSAQEKGYWRASSSTAASITGDIQISDTKLSINFSGFTLAQIRQLSPAESSAVFAAESSGGATANLYRVTVPASKKFLHHNSLCGSDDVQWMVTAVADRTLFVAFLSGANTPVFTPEARANATDLCGTFTYVR
jgi:hypothetical protein